MEKSDLFDAQKELGRRKQKFRHLMPNRCSFLEGRCQGCWNVVAAVSHLPMGGVCGYCNTVLDPPPVCPPTFSRGISFHSNFSDASELPNWVLRECAKKPFPR